MRVHDPRDVSALVADELAQRRTSAYDTARIAALLEPGAGGEDLQAWSDRVWAKLERLPSSDGWAYDEPEGAAAIEAALPGDGTASAHVDPEILLDRIHGAWPGRCAGCVLGRPLEGWPSADIERYLRFTDSWPPDDYVVALDPMPREFPPVKPSWPESTRGRIAGMPRDDDNDSGSTASRSPRLRNGRAP
jgi:hypothetical protein